MTYKFEINYEKNDFFFMQIMRNEYFVAIEVSVHRTLSKIVIWIKMPSTYNSVF
jgi:hypothetical protein